MGREPELIGLSYTLVTQREWEIESCLIAGKKNPSGWYNFGPWLLACCSRARHLCSKGDEQDAQRKVAVLMPAANSSRLGRLGLSRVDALNQRQMPNTREQGARKLKGSRHEPAK